MSNSQQPAGFDLRKYPEEARVLLVQWDSLLLQDGILYRKFHRSDGSVDFLQLILPSVLRRQYVERLHADLGHTGQTKSALAFSRHAMRTTQVGVVKLD